MLIWTNGFVESGKNSMRDPDLGHRQKEKACGIYWFQFEKTTKPQWWNDKWKWRKKRRRARRGVVEERDSEGEKRQRKMRGGRGKRRNVKETRKANVRTSAEKKSNGDSGRGTRMSWKPRSRMQRRRMAQQIEKMIRIACWVLWIWCISRASAEGVGGKRRFEGFAIQRKNEVEAKKVMVM